MHIQHGATLIHDEAHLCKTIYALSHVTQVNTYQAFLKF
jgi:hypothetical protein